MTLPIGEGHPVFVIAEVGVNHNGSVDTAKRLINAAVKAQADAVKFQAWVSGPGDPYAALCLTADQLAETQAYAQAAGILWFATPHDVAAVDILEGLDAPLYKIGSAGLANNELLWNIHLTRKPVIMSTGMATLGDLQHAVSLVRLQLIALLKCTNAYPTPVDQMNLRGMKTLRKRFGLPVGLSSHYQGAEDAVAAVALGARVIEKHITLNCQDEGPDHAASLEPHQFAAMVRAVRNVEAMLGSRALGPQPGEMELRKAVWKE